MTASPAAGRRYNVTYRISADMGQRLRLNVYVNGSYAGICDGYRTRDGHSVKIYPNKIQYPYSSLPGLNLCTTERIMDLAWD